MQQNLGIVILFFGIVLVSFVSGQWVRPITGGFNGTEVDPIFTASPAYQITFGNISQWNSASAGSFTTAENQSIWNAINNRQINGTDSATSGLNYTLLSVQVTGSNTKTITIQQNGTPNITATFTDLQGGAETDPIYTSAIPTIVYFTNLSLALSTYANQSLVSLWLSDYINTSILSSKLASYRNYSDNSGLPIYNNISGSQLTQAISGNLSGYRNYSDNTGLPVYNNISSSQLTQAISANLSGYRNYTDNTGLPAYNNISRQDLNQAFQQNLSTYRNYSDNSGLPVYNNISRTDLNNAFQQNLSTYYNKSDDIADDSLQLSTIYNKTDVYNKSEVYNQTYINSIFNITTYLPYNFTVDSGTQTGGNLTALTTISDNNWLNVSETVSTPGWSITINFTNVSDFNEIYLNAWYSEPTVVTNDEVDVQMFNYNTKVYDTFGNIPVDTHLNILVFSVPIQTYYLNGTNASIRIYQPGLGHSSHRFYLDYSVLKQNNLGVPDTSQFESKSQFIIENQSIMHTSDNTTIWNKLNNPAVYNNGTMTNNTGIWNINTTEKKGNSTDEIRTAINNSGVNYAFTITQATNINTSANIAALGFNTTSQIGTLQNTVNGKVINGTVNSTSDISTLQNTVNNKVINGTVNTTTDISNMQTTLNNKVINGTVNSTTDISNMQTQLNNKVINGTISFPVPNGIITPLNATDFTNISNMQGLNYTILNLVYTTITSTQTLLSTYGNQSLISTWLLAYINSSQVSTYMNKSNVSSILSTYANKSDYVAIGSTNQIKLDYENNLTGKPSFANYMNQSNVSAMLSPYANLSLVQNSNTTIWNSINGLIDTNNTKLVHIGDANLNTLNYQTNITNKPCEYIAFGSYEAPTSFTSSQYDWNDNDYSLGTFRVNFTEYVSYNTWNLSIIAKNKVGNSLAYSTSYVLFNIDNTTPIMNVTIFSNGATSGTTQNNSWKYVSSNTLLSRPALNTLVRLRVINNVSSSTGDQRYFGGAALTICP